MYGDVFNGVGNLVTTVNRASCHKLKLLNAFRVSFYIYTAGLNLSCFTIHAYNLEQASTQFIS